MSASVDHPETAAAPATASTTVTADPNAPKQQQNQQQEQEQSHSHEPAPANPDVEPQVAYAEHLALEQEISPKADSPVVEGEQQQQQQQQRSQDQAVQPTRNQAEVNQQDRTEQSDQENRPATQQQERQGEGEGEAKEGQEQQQQQQQQQQQETSQPVDTRPSYIKSTPQLEQFFQTLPSILENASYDEMWGVHLKHAYDHIPTVNILMKFLRANDGNLKLAQDQLSKALAWRKKMDPIGLVNNVYPSKFKGLGYLTEYASKNRKEIFTWNIYGGAAKHVSETFGNTDEFIKWRVALMEMAVAQLKLNEATTPITMTGEDPYQMYQVHDYLNVSFLRMDPKIKSATKQIIEVFSTAYPELLREKFFVNVPMVMSWVFTALKMFLAKNTIRKMHPITNGANLAREFGHFRDELPKEYGGKAPSLQEAAYGPRLEGESARPLVSSSDDEQQQQQINDGGDDGSNSGAGVAIGDVKPTPTTSAAAPTQGAIPDLKGEDPAQLPGGPSSSKQAEMQSQSQAAAGKGKGHEEEEEDDYDDDDDKSESNEQKAAAKAIDI